MKPVQRWKPICCLLAQLLAAAVVMPLALAQQCCYGDGATCSPCNSAQGCESRFCPSPGPGACCYGDGSTCSPCNPAQGCQSSFCSSSSRCCWGSGATCSPCNSAIGCESRFCSSSPSPAPGACCYGSGTPCQLVNNQCPSNQGCSSNFCNSGTLPPRTDCQNQNARAQNNGCCECLYGTGKSCLYMPNNCPTLRCDTSCFNQLNFGAQTFSAGEEDTPDGFETQTLGPADVSAALNATFCGGDDDATQTVSANLPQAAIAALDADGDGNVTCSEYTSASEETKNLFQLFTYVPAASDGGKDGSGSAAAGLGTRVAIWMAMLVAGIFSPKFF